jgi:hypothetical protein
MMKGHEHLEKKIALINQAAIFKGLSADAQRELAELAYIKRYAKNEIVFQSEEPCDAFAVVEDGLIRVSRYSALGKRLTYLLPGPGEPTTWSVRLPASPATMWRKQPRTPPSSPSAERSSPNLLMPTLN